MATRRAKGDGPAEAAKDLAASILVWAVVAWFSAALFFVTIRVLTGGVHNLGDASTVVFGTVGSLFAAWYLIGRPARWLYRRAHAAPAVRRPAAPVATSRVPIPAGLRFAVLRRDGFRCAYCGRGEAENVKLHIDHLVPVARGGRNEIDNLVTACQDCNLGKSDSDMLGA